MVELALFCRACNAMEDVVATVDELGEVITDMSGDYVDDTMELCIRRTLMRVREEQT